MTHFKQVEPKVLQGLAMIRLGCRFERANLTQNFDEIGRIGRLFDAAQNASEDWLTPLFVKGRNIIRRHQGLETVNS